MSRGERAIVAASVLLAIALFVLHVSQFTDYIADDAAITFAYAKNLAMGHGLVLNPGTDPVEGYSNFAWLVVVLPFCARGADPTWSVKALSVLLGTATLITLTLVAARLSAASRTPGQRWLAGTAALGLAAFPPYAVWACAGLENAFYCALFVAALFLYLRGSWLLCALVLVVMSLTRVEAVAIAALFAVHRTGVLIVDRRWPGRAELGAAAVFLALYGVYTAWHWWYFRALLPNSYVAKSATISGGVSAGALLATIRNGWAYARDQLIVPYRLAWVAPLVVAGLARLRPRVMTLVLLLAAGISILILMTGGDFYPQFRLGTLFLPLWFLLLGEGTRVAVSRVRRPAAAALALIPLLVVCQPGLAVARGWGRGPISMAGMKPMLADRYRQITARMRKSPITVLESDIGSVAYFTDLAVLDLGGLTDLHIARHGLGTPMFLHYVFEEVKPDVIHLRDTWAVHANIPISLIERDYQRLEGQPTGPFADGWYVRRDQTSPHQPMSQAGDPDAFTSSFAAFAPNDAGAAAIAAQARRRCIEQPAACHADATLSAQAHSRADEHRRQGRVGEAFHWYAAAFDADRRNIAALRAREDMRSASMRLCVPAPPTEVRFTIAARDVTVAWTPAADAVVGYLLEAGSSRGRSERAQLRSATPSITVPGVDAGTYFVRVRAENVCGRSEASQEQMITVR
jgi:hypothetical protein